MAKSTKTVSKTVYAEKESDKEAEPSLLEGLLYRAHLRIEDERENLSTRMDHLTELEDNLSNLQEQFESGTITEVEYAEAIARTC